jgi:hypothetical protein
MTRKEQIIHEKKIASAAVCHAKLFYNGIDNQSHEIICSLAFYWWSVFNVLFD